MKPITVTSTVDRPVSEVYEHLAVLGNHEAFTDHMLVDAPRRILERSVAAKGRRVATGEFMLAEAGDGRTEVKFTFSLERAPLWERPVLPLLAPKLRRANQTSLERLAAQLARLNDDGARTQDPSNG